MTTLCVDASFLIAVYDETDQHHRTAEKRFVEYFERTPNQLLAPWPILYETVSTRLVGHRGRMRRFRRDWLTLQREDRLRLLDDQPLRLKALGECLAELDRNVRSYRSLSLADRVIRALLASPTLRIDHFITSNLGDFADICRENKRSMISI